MNITIDNLTRVNNDINGNPRYVVHFLQLINEEDEQEIQETFYTTLKLNPLKRTNLLYEHAIHKAKSLGGKRYRGKDFGGGVVFQSYNLNRLLTELNNLV